MKKLRILIETSQNEYEINGEKFEKLLYKVLKYYDKAATEVYNLMYSDIFLQKFVESDDFKRLRSKSMAN